MEPYLIAIIVIGSLIIIGAIIFVSIYFTLGSSVVVTTTPVSNVTIVPTAVDGERMKVLLPLYIYPPWDSVLVNNHPQNLIAIMNPNSGPGSSYDAEYANSVSNLQIAGSNVIGYVATNYSSNGNISNLLSQVSNYNAWYGVNGIFYDEMSTQASNVSFYQNLYDQTKVVLQKNVNGNANIDMYANFAGDSGFFTSGVISNNVMYIGINENTYVLNVSNVNPSNIAGPYSNEAILSINRFDYISYYGNIYYNTAGSFYSINNSNVYEMTFLGNVSLNESVYQRVHLNENQNIIYYNYGDLFSNLQSVYLSNFQTFSNLSLANYFSFTTFINSFEDTLFIFGSLNGPDTISNSNLLVYSGALTGNLILQNHYSNFYNNGRATISIIDKNHTYMYCFEPNLYVCKIGVNYTLTLTNYLNNLILLANVTNDAEYLFTAGLNVQLFKANLDVPYLIANFGNALSRRYAFCFNESTNSLYYLNKNSLKNYVLSNIFSNSNTNNHIIVGNPGTNTIEPYANTADVLVVYEGSNFSEYSPNSWQSNFSKNKFAALVYNSNEVQMMSAVQSSNQTLGSIYVTDDNLPNPWDTIPSYYALESNLINNNIFF